MPTLLNKTFAFRSFGADDPKTTELQADMEDMYASLSSGLTIGGEPGNGRTRRRVYSNPADTNPNGQYGRTVYDDYVPIGKLGGRSAEGGTFIFHADGTRVYYQTTAPSEGKEGDIWYDIDDSFRLYIFQDGAWLDVFLDVPGIAPTLVGIDSRAYLAKLNDQADALLAERTDRNATIIRSESKFSSATESVVTSLSVLNAQVNHPTTGLPVSYARIITEESVRASADGSAIASIVQAISAGAGGATISSGTVIPGATYKITSVGTGIVVTNIGAANNNLNTTFVSTGSTPTAWNGGSLQETRLATVETWAVAKTSADGSLAAEYVLNVTAAGGGGVARVAGFRTTVLGGSGGSSEFVIQADKIALVNTVGAGLVEPFIVTGGVVYIDKAVINHIDAGAIDTGTITVALELTAATITSGKIRSAATTNFTTDTGFYLAVESTVPKFRVGTTSGERISFDGTNIVLVGSLSIGTGGNSVAINSSGVKVGVATSGSYVVIKQYDAANAGVHLFDSSNNLKAYFVYDSTAHLYLGTTGDITVGTIYSRTVQALSTSDVDTTDSPLYSAGSLYVAGKSKHVGVASFTTTVNISGVLNALSNVDVSGYLAVDGVTYGCAGSVSGVAFAPRQDDVNSGMYSDEADKVKFAAGGSDIFRIVASGTLFIITTGATFRIGNVKAAISSETLQYYVTAQDSDGTTIKLAVVA
jgi:hypothetical protein